MLPVAAAVVVTQIALQQLCVSTEGKEEVAERYPDKDAMGVARIQAAVSDHLKTLPVTTTIPSPSVIPILQRQ